MSGFRISARALPLCAVAVLCTLAFGQAQAAPVDAEPMAIPMSPIRTMDKADDDVPQAPAPIQAPAPVQADLFDPANLPNPAPSIMRITFDDDDDTLSNEAVSDIKAFAYSFKERGGRVSLRGYAGTPGSTGSNERRLSLRRVLAVRDVLMAEGIKPDRLDVRALGGARDNGPQDRVDITKSGREE
ncbi:MAG: OmpA family protein [Parvibaculum sp.]|nr:OmpA family protein [Parvibaculum sp.]